MKKLLGSSAKSFFCIFIYVAGLSAFDTKPSRHEIYYNNNRFADFSIVSNENTNFPCHKMVLAASNQYWETIFSNVDCKECQEGKIELPYSDRVIQIILRRTYIPDKKLIIGSIDLSDYLDLFEFANLSLDESLRNILSTADINFHDAKPLPLLKYAIKLADYHLIDQIFKCAKKPVDDNVYKYLIKMLNNNSKYIIFSAHKTRNSSLINYLSKKHGDLLIVKKNNYILDMKNWSIEEIENELSNYKQTLNELIQNLQSTVLSRAKRLEINSSAQLLSFFIAHYMANISTAKEVIHYVAGDSSCYIDSCQRVCYYAVWSICRVATHRTPHYAASKSTVEEVWLMAQNAAKEAVDSAIFKLQLNDHEIEAKKIFKLAQLFALAYIADPDFQQKYFDAAYEAALEKLNNKQINYYLSKKRIIHEIASASWRKKSLKANPFIKSIKEIMTETATNSYSF